MYTVIPITLIINKKSSFAHDCWICVLLSHYFKIICHIRSYCHGPLGGLKIEGPLWQHTVILYYSSIYLLSNMASYIWNTIKNRCLTWTLGKVGNIPGAGHRAKWKMQQLHKLQRNSAAATQRFCTGTLPLYGTEQSNQWKQKPLRQLFHWDFWWSSRMNVSSTNLPQTLPGKEGCGISPEKFYTPSLHPFLLSSAAHQEEGCRMNPEVIDLGRNLSAYLLYLPINFTLGWCSSIWWKHQEWASGILQASST